MAPYTGSGLITIERDKVYAHAWFKADRTSTVQHIRVPADFEGTGYVNVCFVRALDSKEVFMSPLSYAAAPFQANVEKRRLPITLRAAAKSEARRAAAHRLQDRPALAHRHLRRRSGHPAGERLSASRSARALLPQEPR